MSISEIGLKHQLEIEEINEGYKRAKIERKYQSEMLWKLLPSEIVALIFGFVIEGSRRRAKYREFSHLLQVCKRWLQICFEQKGLKTHHHQLLGISAKYSPESAESAKRLLTYAKVDLLARRGLGLRLAIDYKEHVSIEALLATNSLDNVDEEFKKLIFEWAIKNDQLKVIQSLLPQLNIDSIYLESLIKQASEYGALGALQEIIMKIEKLRLKEADLISSIYVASKNGYKEVLKALLEKSQTFPKYNKVLRGAIKNGHIEVVKMLLTDQRGKSKIDRYKAMNKAAISGHKEIAQLLLDDVINKLKNEDTVSLLTKFIEMKALFLGAFGSIEEIRTCLVNLNGLSFVKKDIFFTAVKNNRLELVKELLNDKDKDFSSYIKQALYLASESGHLEMLRLILMNPEVDPSADDSYALRKASEYGDENIVRELLEDSRVDPSAGPNLAIHLAIRNGHVEVIKELLRDKRVDPAVEGNSAIYLASMHGQLEAVRLLLKDPRVDPSAESNYAIRMASMNGHLKVVELLLKDSRVDPSAMNNEALRKASINNQVEIVELLLEDHRVDPSAENNEALREASKNRYIEVIKLLLKDARVDPSLENDYAILKAS